MSRIRSTTPTGFADPHEVSDVSSDLISRRTMMRRLAAIGLVAASAPLLVTLDAEAKRKGKDNGKGKDKDNGNQRHKGGTPEKAKDQDEQRPEAAEVSRSRNADGTEPTQVGTKELQLANPTFYDKDNRRDGEFLRIGAPMANRKRRVTVQGYIAFSSDHAALMSNGTTFRITCELWAMDSGCAAPSDLLVKLTLPYPGAIYTLPLGNSTKPFRKPFTFYGDVYSSLLNEDVDDGIFDWCDDDLDDIAAYLVVEAAPRGKSWSPVMRYRTNQVQGYF